MVMPGQTVQAQPGETCEDCSAAATKGIVGEVDSFGYEVWWYCDEHYAAEKEKLNGVNTDGHCDWCSAYSSELKYMRDIDEGSSGPVYLVCQQCKDNHNKNHD